MVRTAIQLQCLSDLPESVPTTISRIGDTPLEGVELFDPDVTSPSAIAEALAETDLDPIGTHVYVGRLENEYEDVIETYETIGCRRLIVPIYDPDAFTSIEGVTEAARRLSELAERAEDDGFELLYHNNMYEFDAIEDSVAYDVFVDATPSNVAFELDTGLATYAGADPIDILTRHGDRIPIIHLTDAVPGNENTVVVELGAGELDVEGCVEGAEESGVEWLVYEHPHTSEPLDSLVHGATRLDLLSHGQRPIRSDSANTDD